MESFNVTQFSLDIHQTTILEASAGTGKTFTIEHLFVRMLLDLDKPRALSEILVVTFTKAAVRELQFRIHALLSHYITLFKDSLEKEEIIETPYEYLNSWLSENPVLKKKRLRKLEESVALFQESSIFTIHGFCFKLLRELMLEADACIALNEEIAFDSYHDLKLFVKDFFRTEITQKMFFPSQIDIIIKHYGGIDSLIHDLLQIISKRKIIAVGFKMPILKNRILNILKKIKSYCYEDFECFVQNYLIITKPFKGVLTRSGQIQSIILKELKKVFSIMNDPQSFEEDFDSILAYGGRFVEVLDEDNRKKKEVKAENSYSDLLLLLKDLSVCIQECLSIPHIFGEISHALQYDLNHFLEKEEIVVPDLLLEKVCKSLEREEFVNSIQERYKVVFIDEFQDTDPKQWEIFSKLFLLHDKSSVLYLVGDPKQSIYAFRQADIYTYLKASQDLVGCRKCSLDVNYRSQILLVEALNVLFSRAEPLFNLPRIKGNLPYYHVKAASNYLPSVLEDKKGSVHFFRGSESIKRGKKWPSYRLEEKFFNFIALESTNLVVKFQIAYEQQAILVRDRFQALRLKKFLDVKGIPSHLRRSKQFSEGKPIDWMLKLLSVCLFPYEKTFLHQFLCTPLVKWSYEKILAINEKNKTALLKQVLSLRKVLYQSFSCFFNAFLNSIWGSDQQTVEESFLKGSISIEEYHEWMQLGDLLIDHQINTGCDPQELWRFLNSIQKEGGSSPRFQVKETFDQKGISILTIHVSKGLEFDVVYALGLSNRPPFHQILVPSKNNNEVLVEGNLERKSEDVVCYIEEVDAEKIRQLYVAMTRAKLRLYVPWAIQEDEKEIPIGTKSPMELFMEKLSYHHLDIEGISQGFSITYEDVESVENIEVAHDELKESPLKPEIQSIHFKNIKTTSYSSLSEAGGGENHYEGVIKRAPRDFNFIDKNEDTLPAGIETGIFIHKLLEKLPLKFWSLPLNKIHLWIEKYSENTHYFSWSYCLAQMVYSTFHTELKATHHSFCLKDVFSEKILKEAPFLTPFQDPKNQNSFLKGSMDLCFEYSGKIYLLDWKTNWLYQGYENLNEEIKKHQYDLQAKLYVSCLKQYIVNVCRQSFEDTFGGVFYVFLRGTPKEKGVFYFPMSFFKEV